MKLVFISKEHKLGDVYSFKFSNKTSFSWIAGQSIRLELDTDYLADERRFTISSAPSEKQITITTRVSGSHFKQALVRLKPGDEVEAYGVEGDFTWPKNSPPTPLFLANGLGITPFRSMLAERANQEQSLEAILLYSYHPRAFVFEVELKAWQKNHPELAVHFLPHQRLSAKVIAQSVAKPTSCLVYISGSSRFVNNLQSDLIKNFAILPSRLKLDEFTGL